MSTGVVQVIALRLLCLHALTSLRSKDLLVDKIVKFVKQITRYITALPSLLPAWNGPK